MLLTIATTHQPATDLGYLLHKNPARTQVKALGFGTAHVVYPEADDRRCEAALYVEVDTVKLVRGKGQDFALAQYVNDRPYVASSFLSVAIAQVYGSALGGRCKEREQLADIAIPLTARLPAVVCRGGESLLRGLFEPLGYAIEARRLPLDPAVPGWGESSIFDVTLSQTVRLSALLEHLYVLLPAMDERKHYFVGADEVDKLLRRGGDWLRDHPLRDDVARRYLKRRSSLVKAAIERLGGGDGDEAGEVEERIERPVSLNEKRMIAAEEEVMAGSPGRVLDLGCGEGNLLRRLVKHRDVREIVGVDASTLTLERAETRLKLDRRPDERVRLIQGAATYRDDRLRGFDACALIEVIEHIEPERLPAVEDAVFAHARPRRVVVSTPNAEHNVRFETLPAGTMRHGDHRFEWTRAEFRGWCDGVADRNGYRVRYRPIGDDDPEVGPPTQMAVFEMDGGAA